jgi:hypothetical protein
MPFTRLLINLVERIPSVRVAAGTHSLQPSFPHLKEFSVKSRISGRKLRSKLKSRHLDPADVGFLPTVRRSMYTTFLVDCPRALRYYFVFVGCTHWKAKCRKVGIIQQTRQIQAGGGATPRHCLPFVTVLVQNNDAELDMFRNSGLQHT